MDTPIRALLVEDDREAARLLGEYLATKNVSVVHVEDGPSALARLAEDGVDVVLLDVMLPGGMDGFEVCRLIREGRAVPIVMLTARGDDADRIAGLELGADDYVPKPFNPRELLARVRAVLRRARPPSVRDHAVHPPLLPPIVLGDLEIDQGGMIVRRAGTPIALTGFEFRILVALAKRSGDTVTREELAASVREPGKAGVYDPSVDRSLDVHVSRLRQKLEADPKEPRLIKTVRGIGYVLARPS